MAKAIPYYLLPLPNLQLKTLAEECHFTNIDKEPQTSDWGQRPLTQKQLYYAKMDAVYLAQVHQRLLELAKQSNPDPVTEDLTALAQRYQVLQAQWKPLDSEIKHLEERLKKSMQVQNLPETEYFKLSGSERSTIKVAFTELVKLAQTYSIELDFPVTLTQNLQKELGSALNQLDLQVEKTNSWRLIAKSQSNDVEDDF